MEGNSHTPQKMTGSGLEKGPPGAWVAWYSTHFGPCVGQVAISTGDGWVVVVLREPYRHLGRPMWVRGDRVRMLSAPLQRASTGETDPRGECP